MYDLDSILDATTGGASIISQEHDLGNIIPAAPTRDPGEFAPTQAIAITRASLDNSTGRVSLMSASGILPWHGLGVVVDKACSSEEAIRFAGLDWQVSKIPMSYTWQDGARESRDTFAIVRQDTGRQLGTVGTRYAPIQNAEGFGFLDDVLAQHGARFETAGALFGGEKVFMLAHFPNERFAVNGSDCVEPYVAFCNPHDGTGCATCFPTEVRIVCANTFRTAGAAKGDKGIKIRHTGSVKSKIRAAQTALGIAVDSFAQFRQAAEVMTSKPLEVRTFANAVLDAVMDVTEIEQKAGFGPIAASIVDATERDAASKRFDAATEKRGKMLDEIMTRYEGRRNGVGGMRGTAWAAFNAVTEAADHAKPGRRVGSQDDQRSRRFESILAGAADEMKQVAFRLATV